MAPAKPSLNRLLARGSGGVIYTRDGPCRICSTETPFSLRVGGRVACPGGAAPSGRPPRARALPTPRQAFRPGRDRRQCAALSAEPRVLGLGELERLRDDLADRVADARVALESARVETDNRDLLKKMLAAPADFRWVGSPAPTSASRAAAAGTQPAGFGPIGMLMGWWRVKVSSGCPLAGRLTAVEQEAQGKANGTGCSG